MKNRLLSQLISISRVKKLEIKNIFLKLRARTNHKNIHDSKIFLALEIVAPIIPIPVYWHDINGVVLGLNSHCLKGMGATKASDIIGKTPYDFYPKKIAAHILKHHNQVITTGTISSQDEQIEDIATGQIKVFRNIKGPLYDDEGKILGIIGSAMEVTAEKESERLKIENEKFIKIANQVAHDIRSPLSSLLMIVRSCAHIPESERIALREAATGIGDIANHLLDKYKQKETDHLETEESKLLLVSTTLLELLTAKKYQYKKSTIKFECHFGESAHFVFIKTQFSAFKRMISNLINNAVDALEETGGTISLNLAADNELVKITIHDTGKGMPPELVTKIMNKISVTAGKKEGHGIGLTQVWETLDRNQGEMHIESTLGKGSHLTLTFPRMNAPNWITEDLVLNASDIVIILDDDASIHGAWQARFETILNKKSSVKRKHFEDGREALEFINSLSPEVKNSVLLLSDYELLKQELNGLHIIAKSQISRSILVTSHYADPLIQELATKIGTKILPKQLASEVPIQIIEIEQPVTKNNILDKIDIVIVEDNEKFSDNLVSFIFNDKIVDQYLRPEDLLKNIHRYPKDTKIYLDNNYDNSWLKGIDVARELHERGYKHLYLLSGATFQKEEIPFYLRVIRKDDIDSIEKSKDD